MLKALFLSIFSAGLLVLSFPHASLTFLVWVGLIPFFFALDGASRRRAFGLGYLTGFLFFLGTLWWIGHVTVLGMLLLVSYLALYFGCFGFFCSWSSRFNPLIKVFLIPAGYVALEFIRERIFTGFGWSSLGHSQGMNTLIIQIADLTGVAGVSFLLVMVNVILKEFWARISEKFAPDKYFKVALLTTVGIFFLAVMYGVACLGIPQEEKTLRVAVLQPDIPLAAVWEEGTKPAIVEKHLELSREALRARPDIIFWPETSFPQFSWEHPELFKEVKDFSREAKTPLLIGSVTKEGAAYFNSAVMLNPDGSEGPIYSKTHLVLFGEYIPFRAQLPFVVEMAGIDDFTPGAEHPLFPVKEKGVFAVLICFEDTIPWLAREEARQGAQFLVNITNDAWFKGSPGAVMHFENAIFRTVENRRSLVRSTNTGVSALISPYGIPLRVIQDSLGQRVMVSGIAVGAIPLSQKQPFYTKFGDVFTYFCFLGILMMLIFGLLKKNITTFTKG
ncbi:MAG: apolipoprotein N-acyltransferase [Candidatus Omnitrophica bacterium]|nr:apolipoprotein N-acyltransferase [Candidatus Omnitrophota bacterium]